MWNLHNLDFTIPHILQLTSRFLPGGGGVLPIIAYTGRLRPKAVPFSGFRVVYRRVGILLEVYKRVGKSVI